MFVAESILQYAWISTTVAAQAILHINTGKPTHWQARGRNAMQKTRLQKYKHAYAQQLTDYFAGHQLWLKGVTLTNSVRVLSRPIDELSHKTDLE